ncbi:16995_t:CDS:2 [Gigaspora rosea]|nr:16995_t:CDS:2 [Gigaspora rosea]
MNLQQLTEKVKNRKELIICSNHTVQAINISVLEHMVKKDFESLLIEAKLIC